MTREETIEMLKKDKKQRGNCYISDAINIAIKTLEQEPILDKIRAEIESYIDKEKLNFGGQFDSGLNLALKIIDKYKTKNIEI